MARKVWHLLTGWISMRLKKSRFVTNWLCWRDTVGITALVVLENSVKASIAMAFSNKTKWQALCHWNQYHPTLCSRLHPLGEASSQPYSKVYDYVISHCRILCHSVHCLTPRVYGFFVTVIYICTKTWMKNILQQYLHIAVLYKFLHNLNLKMRISTSLKKKKKILHIFMYIVIFTNT